MNKQTKLADQKCPICGRKGASTHMLRIRIGKEQFQSYLCADCGKTITREAKQAAKKGYKEFQTIVARIHGRKGEQKARTRYSKKRLSEIRKQGVMKRWRKAKQEG